MIEDVLSKLKKAHSEKNIKEIDKQIEMLNGMWQKASQDMQQNTTNSDPKSKPNSKSKSKKNEDDNVTDVDFEEVDDDKKK